MERERRERVDLMERERVDLMERERVDLMERERADAYREGVIRKKGDFDQGPRRNRSPWSLS